jgi:hypothetical protein
LKIAQIDKRRLMNRDYNSPFANASARSAKAKPSGNQKRQW